MRKGKQHWYVGEIIDSGLSHNDSLYEVISAISSKEKFKDGYPEGYTKPKSIVWYYEARAIADGFIFKWNVAQVNEDKWWVLHTPVLERLWNL